MKQQFLVKLTPYQTTFYNEWMLNPSRSDYNIIIDQSISGFIDIKRLNLSLVRFINNNLLMNSNIVSTSDGLFWKNRMVLSEDTWVLTFFSQEPTSDQILKFALEPFDLENDQLIRIFVIKLKDDRYRIIHIFPHLVVDGLSADTLYKELGNYYNDAEYENPINLSQQVLLHNKLNDQFDSILYNGKEQMSNFWQKHLKDLDNIGFKFLQTTETSDKKSESINSVSEFRFKFTEEIFFKVKQLTKNHKLTPYTYGQMIFALLLHRMSGVSHLGINYPIGIKEGQELIFGAHVNTIIKGYHFTSETTLSDLIDQNLHYVTELKKTKAYYFPVGKLVKYAQQSDILEFSFAQTNLKDISINYEGAYDIVINNELNIDLPGKIVFEQEAKDNQLNYRVKYDHFELDTDLVSHFIDIYKRLFVQVLDDILDHRADKEISAYDLLDKSSYQRMVQDWNDTEIEYDKTVTIHELFEKQVDKTPDHIALVYEDRSLTYKELNDKSNQLAHYLLDTYKIKPDELIPLCLNRSEDMFIGILGVLKAGGAYVPMDPSYPMERIVHILEDTNARLVIGKEKTKDLLYECKSLIGIEEESLNILNLDDAEMIKMFACCSKVNPTTDVSPADLSYVIYTSGTTGRPKGVMIEHSGVINLVDFMISSHKLTEYTNVGCYSNYVFDAFVCEAFPVLCHGNTLWLYSDELRKSVNELNEYITENNIEVSFIPPVLLKEILHDTSLQLIFAGGESFPEINRNEYPDIILINEYGPSESTVCATNHYYHEDGSPFNIGRPISNTSVYVLDRYLRPVPVGAVGELYIGGSGLSRGYLNLPELTEERFLVNPFQSEVEKSIGYNGRMYKTGDLGRFLPGGDLEYIGRNDFQVKIRGYRIELGEIESALVGYEGIRQSVVLAKENNSGLKYLVGYYVSDRAINAEDLSLYLSGLLPEYMVPSAYVHLEELPLTINGKLDRRALPEPNFVGDREYVGASNDLEKSLVAIYGDVLGLDSASISIHDDFFRLGGNSIMAIKLISKIHHSLGIKASVAMVFSHKTIFGLAGVLSGLESESSELIRPVVVHNPEDQLLSFAQERLWFIENYEGGSNAYNVPMVFRLDAGTDLSVLQDSFTILIERHDILRSVILTSHEGMGYQKVMDTLVDLSIKDVESFEDLEGCLSHEVGRVFDLSKEVPLSLCIFKLDSVYYLSIVIHHIAFDGWSRDVFLGELSTIYKSLLVGESPVLPSMALQYRDFALWQRDYLSGDV
ncbi:non-ribosomal peptide synthetase, partial [Chryseobacterium potabilaquae]|uniref:non-ribosomal peptide synthetase n=1 Tax=Chryseobacterium potabilaquae TaxID=2675057 RepID=UPI00138A453C